MNIPLPSESVAVALASIAVHADELTGPTGHEVDAIAIRGALETPGVREYLEELAVLGLTPMMRL
jgi:hypothetical protein